MLLYFVFLNCRTQWHVAAAGKGPSSAPGGGKDKNTDNNEGSGGKKEKEAKKDEKKDNTTSKSEGAKRWEANLDYWYHDYHLYWHCYYNIAIMAILVL